MNAAEGKSLLEALDALIEKYHLLKHPFYQAWTAGKLDRETLGVYAEQYYKHVEAFPEYLQTLAVRTGGALRELVQENLAEELHPAMPHPKLWREFAAAVGVSEERLGSADALPQTRELVETFSGICEKSSEAAAVAVLYAYEAQVPEIATQKMDGLRRFYGITEPRAVAYFAVHEEADVRHRAAWRGWLEQNAAGDSEAVLASAERGLKAMWGVLDGVTPTDVCAA